MWRQTVIKKSSERKANISIFVGSIIVLLGILIGGPIWSASSWKSDTLTVMNTAIGEVNSTNRDISTYSGKLDIKVSDYEKVIEALKKRETTIKNTQAKLTSVGGLPFIDVTGAYAKANETRTNLNNTFNELKDLNQQVLVRNQSELEIAKAVQLMDTTSEPTAEQFTTVATDLKKAVASVEKYANSPSGTQAERDYAKYITELATALGDAGHADSEAAMTAAGEKIAAAQHQLMKVSEVLLTENKAAQQKFDKNTEKLNTYTKQLEK